MPHTLIQVLTEALKQDPRFITKEDTLLISVLRQEALKADTGLVSLLLKHEPLKKAFFKTIEDSLVFDIKAFLQFLSNKEFLPDSYTSYKNKVGLTAEGRYLAESSEVVLSWPYKDCTLAGGQDKEDSKRQEVFYNEILAKDEIDRLLDPKAFTHFKKYSSAGVSTLESFQRSEDGTITDNLIIKGNNLLALHSLKKEFAGKVKLIYIDPPYNTGNDSFKYNDKFNHSTWLTFMKNRLEVAKELLRDDGVIFVQCDDNEQAYLKVMMDDIFGGANFISNIIDIVKPEGRRYGFIAQTHEFLLVYGKKITSTKMFEMTAKDKKLPFKDSRGNFDIVGLRNRAVNFFNSENRPNLYFPFYVNVNEVDNDGFMKVSTKPIDGWKKVVPIEVDGIKSVWRWSKEKANNQSDELLARLSSDNEIRIFKKDYSKSTMPTSFWHSKEFITQKGTQQIDKLFNEKIFSFPKPEHLIERIMEISTEPGDIVLDYHLGSGTTCAVAHKMGRQYIGVEQMDYIETISVERMKKVIEGEQGGISKSVEWKGGGEFVYMELMQANERFVGEIQSAGDTQKLLEIYTDIKETGFINYLVDIKAIDASITEFQDLSLEKQKLFLMELLDKNMLYVNYEDMGDARYGVSEGEKSLNSRFYSSK